MWGEQGGTLTKTLNFVYTVNFFLFIMLLVGDHAFAFDDRFKYIILKVQYYRYII